MPLQEPLLPARLAGSGVGSNSASQPDRRTRTPVCADIKQSFEKLARSIGGYNHDNYPYAPSTSPSMPSATASGANPGGDSSARSRDHNQGNQGRAYTEDQKAAVIRIRKCKATAFYDILALESVKTTCTEADIKKAYRKQSLLTHPDKNGHEHADEAFKMVSRAFGILGDKEKREKYDRFGTDPDSRFAAAQAQNPFAGFASRQASGGMGRGGAGMWEEEISPEEMFARFFGGGGGFGGGGPFGGEIPTLAPWCFSARNSVY